MKANARIAALTFLAVVCSPIAVSPLASCELQGSCDGSSFWYDGQLALSTPGNTHVPAPPTSGVVGDTWQSSSFDANWVDYPGERLAAFFPNALGNFPGPYKNVQVYISASPDANDDNWTQAGGNTAEIRINDPTIPGNTVWWITVTNATCAHYYVRLEVEQLDPSTGGVDAGAGFVDASLPTDASLPSDASASSLDATSAAPLEQ